MKTPTRERSLLLLGYAVVILILLVSGFVIVRRARNGMHAAISRDAEAVAASLMNEIERAMRDRVRTIRAFAGTDSELHAAIAESNREYALLGPEPRVQAVIDGRDAEWRATPEDETSEFMQSVFDSAASQILKRTLEFYERERNESVYAEIFVTNRFGPNVGQTGRTSDFRQDDEEWWRVAWRDRVWVSEEIAFDESAGVHSIDIGVRVDNLEGQRLGVMKAVLNVAVLRQIVDGFSTRSRLGDATVELIDANGHLIHRQGDANAFGEDVSEQAVVAALMSAKQGTVVEPTPQGEILRAFVRSRTRRGRPAHGWLLILNQPTETVFAPLRRLADWTLAVGICGALLAALVGYLISQAFARSADSLRETTHSLARSEEKVRSIVTSVADGIITAGTNGVIESVNPAAEEIFGRSAKDMVGQDLTILVPECYRTLHTESLRRFVETREPHVIGSRVELHGLRADGTEFPLALALTEIRDTDSQRFVGVLRDVTQRHEAREALETAKDTAETASRAKSQFLANMSHELRTPLNAIIGYAEMVAEDIEERGESEVVSDLGKIRGAGFDLLGLIDDILDLSKIEAGRLEVFNEAFDLNQALADVVETVHPLIAKNESSLVLEVPVGMGRVHSDMTKLRQILLNLISNAAKFTKYGTIRLLAHRESGEPHDWMTLQVIDDGIGMAAEQSAAIWDAFAQADASTTRRYGGTGLGLTITRRFVEMLSGTIEVSSTPGEGTSFTVRLPARDAPAALDATDAPADGAAAHDASHTTVLVIDDDPDAREMVRRYLVREGFVVVEATNGRDGLRIARELRPTAIILDVMMPGMDGWAVLSAARRDAELSDIPIVMLTMVQERGLGLALGVDAYLTKPVDRATLLGVLAPYQINRAEHRILVVEDDETTREMVVRLLRGEGWQISEAANGVEGLVRLDEDGADLVVLDLMMPVMDGFQFVEAVRADARWRELPLIVVTAKDITDADGRRLKGSVQEILQKSGNTREQLLADVGRFVRQAVARRTRGASG